MIKTLLLSLFFIVYIYNDAIAHSGNPKYHVIIDTDGAVDDFRAICMFLASNDICVLAITCSQGTLEPNSNYYKVNSLLTTLYHGGISVGIGDKINYSLPEWNSFAQKINWGNEIDTNFQNCENSSVLINRTIKDHPDKITLIALGSLKTYSDWLKNYPENLEKIERIIWFNNTEIEKGFNYLIDTASFNFIKKTNISLCIVSNNSNDLICNAEYLSYLKKANSIYAQQIYKVHNQPPVSEKMKQNHLQFWDDLLPLYLTVNILFKTEKKDNINYVSIDKSIPAGFIYETIASILLSGISTNNRVFLSFPVDTILYKKEYAEMLKSTIEKYGEIEWKAITLTNEIHGHTGIYSIIGAKMGIRACEHFNVGVNNLKVITFAGYNPPLSCFNDGIQISTGATIGQGLITVSDSVIQIPTVIFEFNRQKIKISLKNEISKQMQADIKLGIKKYGMTDEYWIYIEKLAMKYWADFDRHEIFILEKI
ncbi:MAG: FmdE family protein [Bacteroidota bacterium]